MSEAVETRVRQSAPERMEWARRYAKRLLVSDLLVLTWAVAGAHVLRFGFVDSSIGGVKVADQRPTYFWVSVLMVALWMTALSLQESRDRRVVGLGPEEYKRVLVACFQLFGVVAIVAYVGRLDIARGYVGVAFPIGTATLLLSRWMWRRWLQIERQRGRWSSRVLLVGGEERLRDLVRDLDRARFAGYRVVAACTARPDSDHIGDVPILGGLADAADVAREQGVDAVIVTAAESFGPKALRRLAWSLEGLDLDLVVVPSLTDVAGPRVHTRPVAGLPLLHVEAPQYEGPMRVVKEVWERAAAVAGIVLLSPVLLVIALLVRASSPGPVFYRQERVGKAGTTFHMTKFRSMVVDAEALLARLAERNEGQGLLFKMKDDPRVTRIGRILRRYSLDELPQLLDVVRGEMSLVGPRPPLPSEVAQYGDDVHRRLLVKPGITGLWQVSGRSDLSWEDSVRLDLYYVENWSITSDFMILWRTLRAVLNSSGAY